jgi:hypothetical protein
VQRSQEKYTSRSKVLVASGQTFASAFSYTSERDEWIQPSNRKLLMSGNYSDCRGPPARNGDGAGNNVGTSVSNGSSTPDRAKRVGMRQTTHSENAPLPHAFSPLVSHCAELSPSGWLPAVPITLLKLKCSFYRIWDPAVKNTRQGQLPQGVLETLQSCCISPMCDAAHR